MTFPYADQLIHELHCGYPMFIKSKTHSQPVPAGTGLSAWIFGVSTSDGALQKPTLSKGGRAF